jgi:hypothetical protein
VGELDPAGEVLLEHGQRVEPGDASVVDALGQADEVAREAVAAHVSRLPDPARVRRLAQTLVERPAVPSAARIALPVRAHDEQRVVERLAGGGALERGLEVELEQVLVGVELE